MTKDSIKEALLEGARVVLLAVVSYLLTAGVLATVIASWFGATIDPTVQVIIIGLITSVLRALDKLLHENAKDQGSVDTGYLGTKGLTGF